MAAAVLVGVLVPPNLVRLPVTRALLAWNTLTVLYVATASVMMARSGTEQMRSRARLQDNSQIVILALVALAAIASLVAIGKELSVVRDLHGAVKTGHVALTVLTVLSSWAFIQMTYALHYAHDFYAAKDQKLSPGIRFPEGEEHPTYGDFFYFAAIIGTSGQTADVSFATRAMRRIGTMHCILAYLFNTVVLALLINITASLF